MHLPSPKAANPIVYKLVRVKGDGTMVPATDDDVMEVEYLLNDNGNSQSSKDHQNCAFPEIIVNNLASKDLPHRDNFLEEKTFPGPLDPKDKDQTLKAKLQFFNLLLWRVKEEERLRLASGITSHHSSYLLGKAASKKSIGNQCQQSPNDVLNLQSTDSPNSRDTALLSVESVGEGALERKNSNYLNTSMEVDGKNEGRSILNQATVIPKPDPDFIRSEISLDNLTIRELHETFKVTFGRETSVKDKQWLKRRIAMALEDKILGTEKQEEMSTRLGISVTAECPLPVSPIVQAGKSKLTAEVLADTGFQKQPDYKTSFLMPFVDIVGKTEGELIDDEDQDGGETGAKRMRKPTRRYIEESSEVESKGNSGRMVDTPGDSDDDYSPPTSRLRSSYLYGCWGSEFVSRHEPLGGSEIEVPFVSRVRRGRPRKNFNALLKYNSSGRAAKLVKKALGVRSICGDGVCSEIRQKTRVVTESNQGQIVHETVESEEPMLIQDATDKHCDSEYLNSHLLDEEYVPTVPTAKGGVRRKHHRPWTLRDVMKLVEGVSRCGVGKWADIKKVAFSSSVYRTSVDLKDKWRNLLRASNLQLQTSKEAENRRKHASVPIPVPILVRVRELSAMQPSEAALVPGSSVSRSGRTVHKKLHI
ncbi:hypothetical protein SUGI_0922500 [Cryptomeria japonica]|nr:hypothetical protein SUGI_0922500 [Cryptomeria japonica]